MKALKIAAVVILAVWMAWVTRQLLEIRSVLVVMCGEVSADIEGWNLKNKHQPPTHPSDRQCAWVELINQP